MARGGDGLTVAVGTFLLQSMLSGLFSMDLFVVRNPFLPAAAWASLGLAVTSSTSHRVAWVRAANRRLNGLLDTGLGLRLGGLSRTIVISSDRWRSRFWRGIRPGRAASAAMGIRDDHEHRRSPWQKA